MEKIEKGQHHCPPRCDPLRGQSAFGLSLMKGDQRPKQLRAKKKPKKKKTYGGFIIRSTGILYSRNRTNMTYHHVSVKAQGMYMYKYTSHHLTPVTNGGRVQKSQKSILHS